MRLRTPLLTFAGLALAVCAGARAQEQPPQKDQQVMDDFVLTRGVSFDGPGKQRQASPAPTPRRRSPSAGKRPSVVSNDGGVASGKKTGGKDPLSLKSGKGGSDSAAQADGAGGGGAKVMKAGAQSLGLGYTILLKDDSDTGGLFTVDDKREFKTGEFFAVSLEPNADGYLYMFSAENGRDPELLLPDARIDGGANAVEAHARATFPTGTGEDGSPLFIQVEGKPATEHLFVILSRRPLADVPTGAALVKFCEKSVGQCAWKPTATQWARILDAAKGRRVKEARNTQLAQLGPQPFQPAMLQRGLKIAPADPKPGVVRVSDSPDADVLITEIVLTHK